VEWSPRLYAIAVGPGAEQTGLRRGDRIRTINPDLSSRWRHLGQEAKLTEGTVSALSGPGGETSYLQITAPVQPGNSGGPVVNYQGHIVGIVSSTIAALPFIMATGTVPQNINYAVKSRTESTPHLRPSGAASHLDPFEPPAG
jgi:hypothetical protein